MMCNKELETLVVGLYSAVPEVRSVSVYVHPQEKTVQIMVNAGLSAKYNAEVMDKLSEAEYAVHSKIQRQMEERWIIDVSYT